MKSKVLTLVVCFFSAFPSLIAQTIHGSTGVNVVSYPVGRFTHNVWNTRTHTKMNTSTDYEGSTVTYALGRQFPLVTNPTDTTVDSTAAVYRTCFIVTWGNGTGPGQIPANASNITVTVNYSTGSSGYTFKVTQITNLGTYDPSTYWSAAGNGSTMNPAIAYNGTSFPSSNIATAIKNALSSGTIYLGALSENETADNSECALSLSIVVGYDRPAAQLSLTARNDLNGADGGDIGEAIYPSTAVSQPSPYSFTAYEAKQLNLAAYDNQSVNGKNWVFNDNEGPANKSYWDKVVNGVHSSQLSTSSSFTTSALTTNDNGATFNAYLKSNTFTTSGTMASSEEWWTYNVGLTGDVTIPSGVTLTIDNGVTVNLNGHALVSSGGTINNNGTISGACATIQGVSGYFGSIQAAINYASSGQSVQVPSGSFSQSPSFSSKSNITLNGQGPENTTLSGTVSITNSSGIEISNLTLSSLSLNNNTSTNISDVNATSASLATIYGGSGNEFYSDNASNLGASFGVTSYDGTGDVADGTSLSNADCAVYLSENASYNVGTNDYFCSNGYDISAVNGAYAYAINNTYSRINPVSVSGNVVVTGNTWVCSSMSSPAKGVKTTSGIKTRESVSLEPDPLQVPDSLYLALLRQINADRAAKKYAPGNYTHSYDNLLTSYKSFVNNKNDRSVVKAALSKLSGLYKAMGDNADFTAYISRTLASGSFDSVRPYFERYLIWNYVDSSDYNDAIKTADQILSSSAAGDGLKAEMLYEEGLIYKYYLADSTKASEVFASLSSNYPSSLLVRFANAESAIKSSYSAGSSQKSPVANQQNAETGLTNYPNPFNPTTMISYSLKTAGHVTLRVYDVLGREVMTLVDGQENAGLHNVQFNGDNLASGVYLYRLTAPGIDQVKKMILMK